MWWSLVLATIRVFWICNARIIQPPYHHNHSFQHFPADYSLIWMTRIFINIVCTFSMARYIFLFFVSVSRMHNVHWPGECCTCDQCDLSNVRVCGGLHCFVKVWKCCSSRLDVIRICLWLMQALFCGGILAGSEGSTTIPDCEAYDPVTNSWLPPDQVYFYSHISFFFLFSL